VNRALRAATIGALLFTPVVLSACSAGQLNQTSTQARDKTGASVTVGALTLRSVQLAYPGSGQYAAGDDAELTMAVANGSDTPDRLVSVTGSGFAGVRISGSGTAATTGSNGASAGATGSAATTTGATSATTTGSATTSGSGTASGSAGAAAPTTGAANASSSGSPSPSASGSGGATATGTNVAGATGSPSSTSASGGGSQSLQVPAQSVVLLGQNAPHVFLQGLTSSLTAGQSVRLTFTFANAGSVTVAVAVAGPSEQVPETSSFNFTPPPGQATTSSAGQG
jgi:copper(I)-binding protein